MKILVTGAEGQLGRCLRDRAPQFQGIELLALSRNELDITDIKAVQKCVVDCQPDAIVNAAAYTAVDKAEDEEEIALAVNVTGVKNLAIASAEKSIPLIHVSTDYVFDGSENTPYLPDSETSPIGIYGKTKLEGELVAKQYAEKLVILRTAWVYSEYGNNFVKTMLRLAESMDEINVVDDQIGCPTYAGNIADAIFVICLTESQDSLQNSLKAGIYHYVDDTQMSWCEFARRVFSSANDLDLLDKHMQVNAISTSEYPTKAGRPAYSVLDASSVEHDYGVKQAHMDKSLRQVLERLGSA